GGSDPFIVTRNASLDQAIATAVEARIINNGQSCIAAKRFIVLDEVAEKFESGFVSRMNSLKVGDPMDPQTELGPLSTADAVKSLHADVQKTIQAGARVLTGGRPIERPGNYYEPTVLTNIPNDSPAYREEFFGPVASVFRVKNIDEAIRIANDSRFGLGASAWTNDAKECDQFENEIEAGMVCINKMVVSDPRMPFGGVKFSGNGPNGIDEGLGPGKVWIDMSTASPAMSRALAARVREKGADMVDAPVSGSVITVQQGKLSVMVGGKPETFDRVKPLLLDLGPK